MLFPEAQPGIVKSDILCLERRVKAFLFLLFKVAQSLNRNSRQNNTARYVNQRHSAHRYIRHIPSQIHRSKRAYKDYDNAGDVEKSHKLLYMQN